MHASILFSIYIMGPICFNSSLIIIHFTKLNSHENELPYQSCRRTITFLFPLLAEGSPGLQIFPIHRTHQLPSLIYRTRPSFKFSFNHLDRNFLYTYQGFTNISHLVIVCKLVAKLHSLFIYSCRNSITKKPCHPCLHSKRSPLKNVS